jgi:hypothetical protein
MLQGAMQFQTTVFATPAEAVSLDHCTHCRAGCGPPHMQSDLVRQPHPCKPLAATAKWRYQVSQCASSKIQICAWRVLRQYRSCPDAQSSRLILHNRRFLLSSSTSPTLLKDPWRVTAPHHPLRPKRLNQCCHSCHRVSIWVGL